MIFIDEVAKLINSKDMEPKHLTKTDCNFILNMDEEKYRQKI